MPSPRTRSSTPCLLLVASLSCSGANGSGDADAGTAASDASSGGDPGTPTTGGTGPGTTGGVTTTSSSDSDGTGAGSTGETGTEETGTEETGGAGPGPSCSGVPPADFDPLAGGLTPPLRATIVVTSAADDGPGSLRAAVQEAPADAVIGFDPALAGQTIAFASTIELDRSVTIDGGAAPGLTLDGGDAVRLFLGNNEQPRRFAFFGLRMIDGRTEGSGGALSFNGEHLEVEVGGCYFAGNKSSEGGAIRVGYLHESTTYIHDSTFVGNLGEEGSTGFSGGAISATGTNLHVARCRFVDNVGMPSGAVYAIHAQPLIEDSVFIHNVSHNGAGALFVDGGGPGDNNNVTDVPGRIEVLRARFEDNAGAAANGGAALLWGYPMDNITVEDTLLARNVVEMGSGGGPQGGGMKVHIEAVENGGQRFRAARVAFVDNISRNQGGGLWLDGSGDVELENVLFSGNLAEGDRGGGATFNQAASARVTVTHATFVNNVGGVACGAFWLNSDTADITFRNSIIAFNDGVNPWERQFGYPPKDGGANIQWPAPDGGSASLGQALQLDPLLGPATEQDGTVVRPLLAGSPATDAASLPAPETDARGAPRNGPPDIGAYEYGPGCGSGDGG